MIFGAEMARTSCGRLPELASIPAASCVLTVYFAIVSLDSGDHFSPNILCGV